MNHGSLFSGIGGFDLAAEWMGWDNVFHCEWNKFGQRVLKHYWPQSISYEDITKTDFTIHRGRIDVLTGGFPCQPYSTAGKRKGKDDERHLWPEMLRAIREIQPRWVVGENVRGLVNWNGGMVFDEVQADLEAEGYEVQPFILPACGKNAPHRRDRVWFVAYAESNGGNRASNETGRTVEGQDGQSTEQFKQCGKVRDAADASSQRCDNGVDNRQERHVSGDEGASKKSEPKRNGRECRTGKVGAIATDTQSAGSKGKCIERQREKKFDRRSFKTSQHPWQIFPTESPIWGGDDGLPRELDGITFAKWRNESIMAYGNAIVPQVVYQIFQAIQQYENNKPRKRHDASC